MPKAKTTTEEESVIPEVTVENQVDSVPAPRQSPVAPTVTFTAEQLAVINQLMDQAVKNNSGASSPNNPISMYNIRDPKKIETVNVKRFGPKFVVGFKNLQNDPFKKIPKYYKAGVDPIRKLTNEPYVVLLLSDNGVDIEEKEVLLVDYMNERENYVAKVLEVKEKETIHDHGILGQRSDNMGMAVDSKGLPEPRTTVLAQSKTTERSFVVQLPGFETTTEFISDFLA